MGAGLIMSERQQSYQRTQSDDLRPVPRRKHSQNESRFKWCLASEATTRCRRNRSLGNRVLLAIVPRSNFELRDICGAYACELVQSRLVHSFSDKPKARGNAIRRSFSGLRVEIVFDQEADIQFVVVFHCREVIHENPNKQSESLATEPLIFIDSHESEHPRGDSRAKLSAMAHSVFMGQQIRH